MLTRELTLRTGTPVLLSALLTLALLSACSSGTDAVHRRDTGSSVATTSAMGAAGDTLPTLSDEATSSDGGGAPRSRAYWLAWNSCTSDNQAEVAEANGGRAAGWYLMDDIIQYPGVSVGDYVVASCAIGAAVLSPPDGDNRRDDDAAYEVASQLLAAELNLNVGAESCQAIEETMIAGHILLSTVGFDGSNDFLHPDGNQELRATAQQIAALLDQYNAGDLCL